MLFRISGGLILAATAFAAGNFNVTDAVRGGDAAALKRLVTAKADVNAPTLDGTTALHWAVENDDLDAINVLVAAGANVKAKDRYGLTPLFYAGSNGNAAIVGRLLSAGADANDVGHDGDTVLMAAARSRQPEVMAALIEKGAAVNAKDANTQQTALMWSVRSNDVAGVKLLLAKGADVNARTRVGKKPALRLSSSNAGSHGIGIVRGGWPAHGYQAETPGGMTALLYAARDGRVEIERELTAASADLNLAEANGITPLMMAISNANMAAAQYLLAQGADVKRADLWGRTALFSAVDVRNRDLDRSGDVGTDRSAALEMIQSLLARDVDVNARTTDVPPYRRFVNPLGDLTWADFTGQTPFLRAALASDVAAMKLLLARGADPMIPTNSATTPLMAAAGVNWVSGATFTEPVASQIEAVKLCLELGQDVNAKNSMGLTPVMAAANRGANEVLQFLVDRGAKLDVKDNEGRTPMVWAEGVFLATNGAEKKPETMALIEKLQKNAK